MCLQDECPSGYAQNAEGLQTIVLFPQVVNLTVSCWDWWDYTSPAYASQLGVQMAAIRCMVERVAHLSHTNYTICVFCVPNSECRSYNVIYLLLYSTTTAVL